MDTIPYIEKRERIRRMSDKLTKQELTCAFHNEVDLKIDAMDKRNRQMFWWIVINTFMTGTNIFPLIKGYLS